MISLQDRSSARLGATVYCTGRTTGSGRSEMNRPETIEETAALVDQTGGRGIPVRVDHFVPSDVQALVPLRHRSPTLRSAATDLSGLGPKIIVPAPHCAA